MSRYKLLFLILIFAMGFLVRLYRFDAPIADWHSWRQTDTSAVSVNFIERGFDIFHPRFFDLSNVPSGVHENPEGHRFVEFPIYNLLQAIPYKYLNILTIEEWGRLVTIFSSLLSAWIIYLLVKKYFNEAAGLASSFFFLFIPYNIFFGRVILPDSTTVAAYLTSIYFFGNWIDKKKLSVFNLQFLSSVFFVSLSLLLKPFAVFFFLPMLYLVYDKFEFDFLKKKELWIFAFLGILPFALWRIWMLQYPGGIPQSSWLVNGSEIMFKGAFFEWIFAERIGKMILGYWGLPLLILGILLKLPKKAYLFFFSFMASSLLYLFVIATGNVQHDYYQILIMPSMAIYLGLGSYFLWENKADILMPVSRGILIICVLFMLAFGWYNIRGNYNINQPELVKAGAGIDKIIPKDALVVVPAAMGDTTALYFMKRSGWSSLTHDLPKLVGKGADYLVIFNPEEKDLIFGKYRLLTSTPEFALFDLHSFR